MDSPSALLASYSEKEQEECLKDLASCNPFTLEQLQKALALALALTLDNSQDIPIFSPEGAEKLWQIWDLLLIDRMIIRSLFLRAVNGWKTSIRWHTFLQTHIKELQDPTFGITLDEWIDLMNYCVYINDETRLIWVIRASPKGYPFKWCKLELQDRITLSVINRDWVRAYRMLSHKKIEGTLLSTTLLLSTYKYMNLGPRILKDILGRPWECLRLFQMIARNYHLSRDDDGFIPNENVVELLLSWVQQAPVSSLRRLMLHIDTYPQLFDAILARGVSPTLYLWRWGEYSERIGSMLREKGATADQFYVQIMRTNDPEHKRITWLLSWSRDFDPRVSRMAEMGRFPHLKLLKDNGIEVSDEDLETAYFVYEKWERIYRQMMATMI